jgi:hypothetical protein
MIDKQTDQVAWALLMYELEDAEDGLKSLFQDIAENKEFSEIEFGIHMRHIYGHLNRAWNGRNATEEQHRDESLWNKWGQLPTDLEPL